MLPAYIGHTLQVQKFWVTPHPEGSASKWAGLYLCHWESNVLSEHYWTFNPKEISFYQQHTQVGRICLLAWEELVPTIVTTGHHFQ